MNAVPVFKQFLNEAFAGHDIAREKTGSIVLVGKDLDPFKEFYEEFSTKVLKPVADNLPNKPHLLKIIKDAIERKGLKQKKLDNENS